MSLNTRNTSEEDGARRPKGGFTKECELPGTEVTVINDEITLLYSVMNLVQGDPGLYADLVSGDVKRISNAIAYLAVKLGLPRPDGMHDSKDIVSYVCQSKCSLNLEICARRLSLGQYLVVKTRI